MRTINKIIIHCSESDFGNAQLIESLHRGKESVLISQAWPEGTEVYRRNPFRKIGYHYVILNGFIQPAEYQPDLDGTIEIGRSEEEEGAHCYGQNQDSLGICLVGKTLFSARQLYWALPELLTGLCQKYSLSWHNIHAHCEFSQVKRCPHIDIELIRHIVRAWNPNCFPKGNK